MTDDPLYIAVDLGAGSGRVFLAGVARAELLLEEVRRFQYPPVQLQNHLRWNLPEIFEEIKTGIRVASERARELRRPIQSIGVDSWGVDYGLIDAEGKLRELPICYRDERTQGVMEQVVAPATHDTGSAVAGAPIEDGWAYISSGTWSLVGVERDEILINHDVARLNFTNEGGAFGSIRFLKNVMGLWILESCRREWEQQ